MMHASAGPRTVILETPETVAVVMRSYLRMGMDKMVQVYLKGLTAATEAACQTVPYPWHLVEATQHMAPQWDISIPQPHVHVTVADAGDDSAVIRWAIAAHDAFQATLCRHVQHEAHIGVTLDVPHPPGWEITALMRDRGAIGRHRCVPPSPRVMYPADLVGVRVAS